MSKPLAMKRGLVVLAGVGVVALLSACNPGVLCLDITAITCTPLPPPTPSPPPSPEPPLSQGSGSLRDGAVAHVPLTLPSAGSLSVLVEWTFATNNVDVHLARGSCALGQFASGLCDIAAVAASTTAKPERLTYSTAAAGAYALLISNRGPADESIAYQVLLTP